MQLTAENHGVRDSNTTLLQKLASAVNGHAATATFACGGSVPISDLSTGNLGCGAQNLSPSVTIRWDSKDSYFKQSKLSCLLIRCKPATFGIDGRDVLDEKYRKAWKLDPSEFSTNFHPHGCGILDSVQQILLPSTISRGQGVGIGPQGVRAELYNLNVCRQNHGYCHVASGNNEILQIYSAPSGKFLSHVDTPRGVLQFGSLVVFLPCQHEGSLHTLSGTSSPALSCLLPAIMLILQSGGELRVKHRGGTVDFGWGHTSPQSVQWAAFYGDCEHEVLEVTKGHRITLTYNLYYSSIGKLAQPVSNPHHLPLFDIAREMLLQQNFMRQGERSEYSA